MTTSPSFPRRSPRARSAAATTAAVEVTRQIPMPNQAPALDLRLSMGDLKAVALAELRERYLQARQIAEAALKQANAAYAAAEQQLETLGRALVDRHRPDVPELLAQLKAWSGQTWQLRARRADYSSYYHKEDPHPVIDIASQQITGRWEICHGEDTKHKSATVLDELSLEFTVPFDETLRQQIATIAGCRAAVNLAQQDLTAVNRLIADLSHRGDAIQSALTKEHLSGRLQDTTDILGIIERAVGSVALPPAVAEQMPQRALPPAS